MGGLSRGEIVIAGSDAPIVVEAIPVLSGEVVAGSEASVVVGEVVQAQGWWARPVVGVGVLNAATAAPVAVEAVAVGRV